MERMQLLVLLNQRQQLALAAAQQIHFIENQTYFCWRMLQHLNSELIALIEFARRIHDQKDEITAFQRLPHFDHHLTAQRTVRLVYARSVDQNDLRSVVAFTLGQIHNTLNPVASSLDRKSVV